MTGKYESLLPEILPEPSLGNGRYVAGIRNALNWLDEHPEQVPGRTITRSTMHELISEHFYTPVREIDVEAYTEALGRLVVPDPEPTNAEKLEADLSDWYAKNGDARPTLTEHLIERGWVKTHG